MFFMFIFSVGVIIGMLIGFIVTYVMMYKARRSVHGGTRCVDDEENEIEVIYVSKLQTGQRKFHVDPECPAMKAILCVATVDRCKNLACVNFTKKTKKPKII